MHHNMLHDKSKTTFITITNVEELSQTIPTTGIGLLCSEEWMNVWTGHRASAIDQNLEKTKFAF